MDNAIRALIVDDSLAICQLLDEYLQHFGVDYAESCHCGEDALRLVKADPARFDAIFVDLHMEGMDGLELMHQLSDIRYRGGVIIISALNNRIINFTLELVSSYHLRVLGSMEKPFESSLIAFMVRRIRNSHKDVFTNEELPKRRDVQNAIRHGQLRIYFQPLISSKDNSILGFECLTRLDMGADGILQPAQFMPVVERFNLFEPLMEALFDAAGKVIPSIQACVGNDIRFSFNVSPQQLFNDNFPDLVSDYLDNHNIDKNIITLEITENQALTEEQQLKNLNRLRIHGFRLSLDDYGAGFTNLRQIKSLPFNEIKLDALMIEGLHNDRVLRVIVESICKVTAALELSVVAEGVSNAEDLLVISHLNIDSYQGYLFCRPKPTEEILRWVKHWQDSIEDDDSRNSDLLA
ncbi:MAG: EAL domain-containing protein (putative c-di-GMP-specific phosphodiesterase class I) [Flavobacteriales bacterium]|jgi:EAL domain-containing protein (putative c-di-GMP-specific phosphodiesterase class I)/CheY-like chemotaxis protein